MNKRHLSWVIALLAMAMPLAACKDTTVVKPPIPSAPPTATPCAASCGPVFGSPAGAQVIQTSTFSLAYYNPPWQLKSHDDQSMVLSYSTDYGEVLVSLMSTTVTDGTTADALLATWVKQNIDPAKYQGINDYGIIHGAEIGYVPGAGKALKATLALPNAPSAPVFVQVMAATRGTTGLIFVAVSPLDPHTPDPGDKHQVRGGRYDLITNSVRWS